MFNFNEKKPTLVISFDLDRELLKLAVQFREPGRLRGKLSVTVLDAFASYLPIDPFIEEQKKVASQIGAGFERPVQFDVSPPIFSTYNYAISTYIYFRKTFSLSTIGEKRLYFVEDEERNVAFREHSASIYDLSKYRKFMEKVLKIGTFFVVASYYAELFRMANDNRLELSDEEGKLIGKELSRLRKKPIEKIVREMYQSDKELFYNVLPQDIPDDLSMELRLFNIALGQGITSSEELRQEFQKILPMNGTRAIIANRRLLNKAYEFAKTREVRDEAKYGTRKKLLMKYKFFPKKLKTEVLDKIKSTYKVTVGLEHYSEENPLYLFFNPTKKQKRAFKSYENLHFNVPVDTSAETCLDIFKTMRELGFNLSISGKHDITVINFFLRTESGEMKDKGVVLSTNQAIIKSLHDTISQHVFSKGKAIEADIDFEAENDEEPTLEINTEVGL